MTSSHQRCKSCWATLSRIRTWIHRNRWLTLALSSVEGGVGEEPCNIQMDLCWEDLKYVWGESLALLCSSVQNICIQVEMAPFFLFGNCSIVASKICFPKSILNFLKKKRVYLAAELLWRVQLRDYMSDVSQWNQKFGCHRICLRGGCFQLLNQINYP